MQKRDTGWKRRRGAGKGECIEKERGWKRREGAKEEQRVEKREKG